MTTISRKLTDLVPSEPTVRCPAGSVGERRSSWRLALDSAWELKIDEVIALSKASRGLMWEDDDNAASRPVQMPSQLEARTVRACDELAAIEDAIARIDDGTYGLCAGCDEVISEGWLATKPEARYCPDCSLRLVSWQPPDLPLAPLPPRVQRTRPKAGPGVRRDPKNTVG